MDLAEAHLKAFEKLYEHPMIRLNLGTGSGFSNMEIVNAVGRVAGVDLRPEIGPRRPGDPPELVAPLSEAFRFLGWRPKRSQLDAIISEVWQWISDNPAGYPD
jgi:UDP-glucose 4-epimerase